MPPPRFAPITKGARRASVRYHHGDLPEALRSAAVELITEKGAAGFSLREVARRAGVSHAAPAYHFGDTRGLLTSIAVEAFQHLHDAGARAVATTDDPVERLSRLGESYVRTGAAYPAHCAVVFRRDLVDGDDPAYAEWGDQTYRLLEDAVRAVLGEGASTTEVDNAARLCWSAMQGLLVLHPAMSDIATGRGEPPVDPVAQAGAFCRLLLVGLRHAAADVEVKVPRHR